MEKQTETKKVAVATPEKETTKKVVANPESRLVSKSKLLEAGTYFGHKSHMWNPKMKPFIHSKRGNTHILDLEKTQLSLEFAYNLILKFTEKNARFIFVGTRDQAKATIKENALRTNSYWVSNRWLGGTLTNHGIILKRVEQLVRLERLKGNNFEGYTKKEAIDFTKQLEKLQHNLEGIRNMRIRPEFMIVADPSHDKIAVAEARKMGIKIIGIVDSNVDPTLVDVPIPGNDDSKKSVILIMTLLADAIVAAKGGDVKFAFRPNEEIILPTEPKKPRRPRDDRHFQGRNRRFDGRFDRFREREESKKLHEAEAGKKQISSMDDLTAMTVSQLKDKAKIRGIKGYSDMDRNKLIEVLTKEEK